MQSIPHVWLWPNIPLVAPYRHCVLLAAPDIHCALFLWQMHFGRRVMHRRFQEAMAANLQDVAQRMRDIKSQLEKVRRLDHYLGNGNSLPVASQAINSAAGDTICEAFAQLHALLLPRTHSRLTSASRGSSPEVMPLESNFGKAGVEDSHPFTVQEPGAEAAPTLPQREALLDELMEIVEDINFARWDGYAKRLAPLAIMLLS